MTTPLKIMLYTNDLETLLRKNKKTSLFFRGVYANDELPTHTSTPALYVCNTDPSTKTGQHWVVIFINDKRKAEYFDSFGLHPSIKNFENFLSKNSLAWKCNIKPVQHILSDACGYHCLFYAIHRCIGFDMNAIINMYTDNLIFNDELVKHFVHERL